MQVEFAHHGVAGLDAHGFKKFDFVLAEDKGAAGFTYQNKPLDKTRRGAYASFHPPNLVT